MSRKVSVTQRAILDQLVQTAELRKTYEESYRAGILEASNAGISNAEIARTLGVTGETIRQIVARLTDDE